MYVTGNIIMKSPPFESMKKASLWTYRLASGFGDLNNLRYQVLGFDDDG